MGKMKKWLVAGLAAVLSLGGVSALGACGGRNSYDRNNTLVIWAGGQWQGNDGKNLQAFIDEISDNKTFDFKIKLEIKTDLENSFSTAMSTGRQPDLMIWDRFNTPTYAKGGYLQELDAEISAEDQALFHSEAMNELVYNGHVYGLPIDIDAWGIYVNTSIVEKYNTAHPSDQIVLNDHWTWDEMLTIAEKLKTVSGVSAGYATKELYEHFYKYFLSTGIDLIGKDGTVNFDNAETRGVLDYFKKLCSKLGSNGDNSKSAFQAGMTAMLDQSVYYATYLKKMNFKDEYRFMPTPRYSVDGVAKVEENIGMIGGFGMAIPMPKAQFKTEVWKKKNAWAITFMKGWTKSEELSKRWVEIEGNMPALNSLYADAVVTGNPVLNSCKTFVESYKTRPQVPGFLDMQKYCFNQKLSPYYATGSGSLDALIADMTSTCNKYLTQK